MAKIVEHIDGRPVTTVVEGTPMDVHKLNCQTMSVRSATRMSTGCVMVEYRSSKGIRTMYIWP